MNKILILGGGGFIGYNIAKKLMENGDSEITLADIKFPQHILKKNNKKLKLIIGDLSLSQNYKKFENYYDKVYMMAAIVGVNRTIQNPTEVIRVNSCLVNNTIEWLHKAKIKKLLFASSSENYAATTDFYNAPIPTPENIALAIENIKHPRWSYAITKIFGESAFIHAAKKLSFDTTIIRYQNAYGPDMGFRHVIPHLVQRFIFHKKNKPFIIYGPKQTRSFCYISDAVEGTIKAMNKKKANNEIYHLGNNEEITIEKLTKEVGSLMGYQGKYLEGPCYPDSVQRRCPNILKSKRDLGYVPLVSFKKGVKKTVNWYRKHFNNNKDTILSDFKPPNELSF